MKKLLLEVHRLQLQHPSSKHASQHILDIDLFELEEAQSCAIIGASGAGKTRFLYLLKGLIEASAGSIAIRGKSCKDASQTIALIFQDHGLLPWKTAWENIAVGLQIRRSAKAEVADRVSHVLEKVHLTGLCHRFPHQLSGGQQQRVAIARALVLQPTLLLMDEPFSALDPFTRESLQELILRLQEEHGFSSILVTHNIEEALLLGQRVVVFGSNPGRIVHQCYNPHYAHVRAKEEKEFHLLQQQLRQLLSPFLEEQA